MRKQLVYAAGGITGYSWEEAQNWRTYLQRLLEPNIIVLSPLRGKSFLNKEKSIKDHYEQHPISTPKGIHRRDSYDVLRSDLIFVNFLKAQSVSIGTVWEIGAASILGKPVIVVMEDNNIHQHSLINQSAIYIVDNLEDGAELTKQFLLP